MPLLLNVFLLLFGAVQGFLLSMLFLRGRLRHHANIFITLFLATIGLQLTFKVLSKGFLFEHALIGYAVSYFLPFLAGPLFYLFLRSRTSDRVFRGIDMLHFLPFALGAVHQILFVRYGEAYALVVPSWTLDAVPRALLQLISLGVYAFLGAGCIRPLKNDVLRAGLNRFLVFVAACEVLVVLSLALQVLFYDDVPDPRPLFIGLTLLTYWISWQTATQPELFVSSAPRPLWPLKVENIRKYAHSGLKSGTADHIETLLREAMGREKSFLEAGLTLDSLSQRLGISRHHLSQILNERFGLSYMEYVNGFRLDEARTRLSGGKYDHYTIAAIAFDCGFSSLSSFNALFKKKFGTTPSQCRNRGLKLRSA